MNGSNRAFAKFLKPLKIWKGCDYITESKYKAQTAWNKSHTTQYTIKLNNNTDKDIIEHIAQKENKTGYFKKLVRADIAKEK